MAEQRVFYFTYINYSVCTANLWLRTPLILLDRVTEIKKVFAFCSQTVDTGTGL